ncbi:MAG TPA: ParB/RepB/Spo0J family partition protein [Bacteroidetes bacterium]|nr:ParB/RepB/Spo0J family partition protein [Bacteroidota bacterium]
MARKNALGRGLGALIDDADKEKLEKLERITEVEIEKISVNPFQPRSNFDKEALQELASSIRELGIIQPISIREMEDGFYQLITGERRLKAAAMAGLKTIPAYIRTADDQAMLELALVENIQREDLDAIEIAISYHRLIEECNLTQENLSERVGKKRSTVANYLRLLRLPAEIQLGIRERKITMGHARSLISIDNPEEQIELYYQILRNELSVRQTEDLVRKLVTRKVKSDDKIRRKNQQLNETYQNLQKQLSGFFSADIQIRVNNKGKGKIVIPFETPEDLEKIIELFDRLKA